MQIKDLEYYLRIDTDARFEVRASIHTLALLFGDGYRTRQLLQRWQRLRCEPCLVSHPTAQCRDPAFDPFKQVVRQTGAVYAFYNFVEEMPMASIGLNEMVRCRASPIYVCLAPSSAFGKMAWLSFPFTSPSP